MAVVAQAPIAVSWAISASVSPWSVPFILLLSPGTTTLAPTSAVPGTQQQNLQEGCSVKDRFGKNRELL